MSKKIVETQKKIENMESEEVILTVLQDVKKELSRFKTDVNKELQNLYIEVTTLKTKAGIIGGIAGSFSAIIVGVIVGIILYKINNGS